MDSDSGIERNKQRINELIEVLEGIAGGEYSTRVASTENDDEMEALGLGVNMLAEEIEAKVNDLEKMNSFFTDRELAMVKLKERNRELEEALKKQTATPA